MPPQSGHWEKVKKLCRSRNTKPHLRCYALAELVNIHDAAITFEPIHKVVFDTEPETFFAEAKAFFADNIGEGRSIDLVTGEGIERLNISGLTIGELIGKCEDFCKAFTERHGGYIDYIHGDCECVEMVAALRLAPAFSCRSMEKSELFSSDHEKRSVPQEKHFPSATATISATTLSAAKSGNLPL